MAIAWPIRLDRTPAPQPPAPSWRVRVPIAVIGDSDSHSYHDRVLIPPPLRGGEYRDVTFQWTEILHRLRDDEVDLGSWGEWGSRTRYALVRRILGQEWRVPRKEDFEHDFALSGARCESLTSGAERQVPPLISLLKRDPARWSRGVVVVRVGVNSVQRDGHIEQYAARGLDAAARARMDACVGHIDGAVRAIREAHADVAIAVVGLFEEPDAAPFIERRFEPQEMRNIRAALAYFDEQLLRVTEDDPRIVLVEGRDWWQRRWGTHGPEGEPLPNAVSLGGTTSVTNSVGDHPANAVLTDGHAGTVVNGFWLRHLVETLNTALGLGLSPILDGELADLVDPDGRLGLSPGPPPTGEPTVLGPRPGTRVTLSEVPWTVPDIRAVDGSEGDITGSVVGWLEGEDGRRLWLYGSGAGLQLRTPRHAPGDAVLTLRARDRTGRSSTVSIPLVITG